MGDFTFYANEMDFKDLQLILDNWESIDERNEILSVMKDTSHSTILVAKANLRTHRFKFSGGIPGYRGPGAIAKTPGYKTGNLYNSMQGHLSRSPQAVKQYSGFKRGKGGGNHAHFLDRGTEPRYTRRGYYRGSVSAGNPNIGSLFWTKPVETQGALGQEKLNDAIYDTLDKISNRR